MKPICFPLALLLASTGAYAGLFGPDTSGKDADCLSKASYAWCFMDLVGSSEGLSDSPAGSLPTGVNVPGTLSKAVDVVGVGAQVTAGALDLAGANMFKVGATGGVLSLLSAFRDASATAPGTTLKSFALVPATEGDPNQAVVNALTAALMKMFGADKVELVNERHPDFPKIGWPEHLRFTGGELCSTRSCVATIRGLSQKMKAKPVTIDVPDWVGQAKGQAVMLPSAAFPIISLDGKRADPEVVVYELAKYLPGWIYYYLPPSKTKPVASLVAGNQERFFVKPTEKPN